MTRRTGYSLIALTMVALTVMSCTTLLGIDTGSDENPCDSPQDPLVCGVGACRTVIPACVNGLPNQCAPVSSDADEICDGIDNNCDGLIDEGCPCTTGAVQICYSGTPLTRNVGICHTGIQTCANGIWSDCKEEQLPELENCSDGFDNDCNGKVNDSCPCTSGQVQQCYGGPPGTLDVSNCKTGQQSCDNGFWGDCKSDVIPGAEVCDGVDNDCNGNIDEIAGCECSGDQKKECYTGDEKLIGIGICKKGTYPCKGGKFDTSKCENETLPGAEVCNGLDDDCNGLADDAMGLGLECTTNLPGVCKLGKTDCGIDEETGMPGTICKPDTKPFDNPEQACNLIDDNCDGVIDESGICCPGDGIQNGSESDVNCGGTCPQKCADGKKCFNPPDCDSAVCTNGICVAETCMDGVENGTETDKDCGGSSGCPGCQAGQNCEYDTDCKSFVCNSNTKLCQAPTCFDSVQNGSESDVDCGQGCNPKLCENLQKCESALDCKSFSCKDKLCQSATCNDAVKNLSETDVDCGGGQCKGCAVGQGCKTGTDCEQKVCGANLTCLSPTCSDGAANGQETDVDCGGPDCNKPCKTGQICKGPTDCESSVCVAGKCLPSNCDDDVLNGDETDVDCGGPCPAKCGTGQKCDVAADCYSDVCSGGSCQAPSCIDTKKNGAETDIDCGGPCVQQQKKCADGLACASNIDCQSGVCTGGICVSPQCTDQVQNGKETDVDCGGGLPCQGCDIGKKCIGGGDCKTSICTAGLCAPKPDGEPCSSPLECAKGNCVDGVCCNLPCTGTCQACSAAKKGQGADGVCQPVVAGQDPGNECATENPLSCGKTGFCNGSGDCANYPVGTECVPATCKDVTTVAKQQQCNGNGACLTGGEQSCVPYTCSAGVCNFSCAVDLQCAAGYYCSGNQCIAKKTNGSVCSGGNACSSGNCIDGVCCDSACTGTCQACSAGKKGQGVDGVCGPIATGLDPEEECPQQAPTTCGTTGTCDGGGKCGLYQNIQECAPAQCANATTLAQQRKCSGIGTCEPLVQTSCAPYLCQNAACTSMCINDAQCATGNYCLLTACTAKLPNGSVCSTGNACSSGNCVDGVCCDSACTGSCQACSASKKGSGTDGVCGSIANNADPDNECADNVCAADGTTLNKTQVCNGAGACKVGTTQNCSPALCKDGACITKCASDVECIVSHYCDTGLGQCLPKKTLGQTCADALECGSAFCVDGVCCNGACDATCKTCALAGNLGTCSNVPANGDDNFPANICTGTNSCDGAGNCEKENAAACGAGAECLSGNCVDGVCCNSACNTACKTCALAGSVGTCSNLPANQDDNFPANICTGTNTCDGAGNCKKENALACGVGTECLSGNCADGVCCDSACNTACKTCSAAGSVGTCTNVAANVDDNSPANICTGTNTCDGAGNCKKENAAACSAGTDCLSGFCADGVCCNAACNTACKTCNAAGNVGTCTNVAANVDDNSPANICTGTNTCDGAGNCKKENAAACSAGTECLSGNCVDSVCCSSACNTACKTCALAGSVGTCSNVLANQDDNFPANICTGTNACDGAGNCKKENAAACVTGTDCLSGNCVDGVCCNTTCSTTCMACNVAGFVGTCANLPLFSDDNFPANVCTLTKTCDGSGSCLLKNGESCAADGQCASGTCTGSPKKCL